MSLSQTFERIYRGNRWNGRESRSGPGSGSAATRKVADWISSTARDLEVRSVLDIGCGDNFWMPDLPGYVGIDVSRTALARAAGRHPERRFLLCDAREVLPAGDWDLVIVRDVIQHLSLSDGAEMLGRILAAPVRFLMASTYLGDSERHASQQGVNVDIRTGEAYANDLTLPPFDLWLPWDTFPDGWDYETGEEIRDPAKWLGLWRLED